VGCRSPLPRMTPRTQPEPPAAAQPAAVAARDMMLEAQRILQEEVQNQIIARTQQFLRAQELQAADMYGTTTTTEEEEEEEELPECSHCQNRAAIDCGNQMCGRCCGQTGSNVCNRHGRYPLVEPPLPQDQPEEDTTTTEDFTEEIVPQCPQCQRNLAASHCGNQMCGRCCPQHGRHVCHRHPTTTRVIVGQDDTTTTQHWEEDEGTTTTVAAVAVVAPSPYASTNAPYDPCLCRNCDRNRAAMDCDLAMCGRCCVMSGWYCSRHNM
jgi:hypothetical protein